MCMDCVTLMVSFVFASCILGPVFHASPSQAGRSKETDRRTDEVQRNGASYGDTHLLQRPDSPAANARNPLSHIIEADAVCNCGCILSY